MTSSQLVPALVVPFIAWRVYVRVRRNIGRQRLQPGRLIFRIVVFALLSVALGVVAFNFPPSLAALVGGLFLGALLAWWGLRLTRFESTEEGKFYIPNTFIGLAVTLVLVGRIIYRVYALMGGPASTGRPVPPLFQSPMTLLMFGLTAGYYIAYFAGVLFHGKKLAPGK